VQYVSPPASPENLLFSPQRKQSFERNEDQGPNQQSENYIGFHTALANKVLLLDENSQQKFHPCARPGALDFANWLVWFRISAAQAACV
jgi:hypothetical protein